MLYLWLKGIHVISVISWMAGLLYLPRLFYYHALNLDNAALCTVFHTMERRLLRFIMLPAKLASLATGIWIILLPGVYTPPVGWFHLKVTAVLGLFAFHGFCIRWWKSLSFGQLPFNANTFRVLNEVPTILMILIVLMVILKPF